MKPLSACMKGRQQQLRMLCAGGTRYVCAVLRGAMPTVSQVVQSFVSSSILLCLVHEHNVASSMVLNSKIVVV